MALRAAGGRGTSSNYPHGLRELAQPDALNRWDPREVQAVRDQLVAQRLATGSQADLKPAEQAAIADSTARRRLERSEARGVNQRRGDWSEAA